jgi:hypothetical protein
VFDIRLLELETPNNSVSPIRLENNGGVGLQHADIGDSFEIVLFDQITTYTSWVFPSRIVFDIRLLELEPEQGLAFEQGLLGSRSRAF